MTHSQTNTTQKLLTIKAFAALMEVSTHQIRYFEEKGVLPPEALGENGYRLYGMASVYRLSQILMLREMGLSVEEIKDSLATFEPKTYYDRFAQSIQQIDAEIARLERLKQAVSETMAQYDHFETRLGKAIQSDWHRHRFIPLETTEGADIKMDSLMALPLAARGSLHELNVAYLYEHGHTKAYLVLAKANKEAFEHEVSLPAGRYYELIFVAKAAEDYEKAAVDLIRAAARDGVPLIGPIIWMEHSSPSIFTNAGIYVQVAQQIAE